MESQLSPEELLSLDFARFDLNSPAIGDEINNYIHQYESYKHKCDEAKDYVEAQKVFEKLTALKKFEEARKKNQIEVDYANSKQAIDDECAIEVAKFNDAWDHAMNEYDFKTNELVSAMKQRHDQEYKEFQEDLRVKNPLRPKFSSDLLNMRRVQQMLAKQNNYSEAHRMQKNADALEATELAKLTAAWELKLQRQETLFKSKQESEMTALVKRIQTGQEEQNKVRQTEYERLLQRYANMKIELEKTHLKNRKLMQDTLTADKMPLTARGRIQKKLGSTTPI